MYELKNDHLTVRFDGQGRLTWLENNRAGYGNIVAALADDSFKLVYRQGGNWENVVLGRDQQVRVVQQADRLEFWIDKARTPEGDAPVSLVLTVSLAGEDLVFGATIRNDSPDALVTDFYYPQAGAIRTLSGGKPALLWPYQSGVKITNIGERLAALPPVREEHNALCMTYPHMGSMQWMALVDGQETLYLGVHDDKPYASELRVVGRPDDSGVVSLGFDRLPFVTGGETWNAPDTVLKLYTGSWHRGADDYARFANLTRPHHKKPRWVEDMQGYFLVINKQQYGHEMWPYNTLPELYQRALDHGCDVLGLFGWYDSGHDNQYPDLEVSESLGGAETLKDNIKAVQQAGGHVTLYLQGHLIDVTSPFYKNGGHRFEIKSLWGTPYYEQYNKYHDSAFLKNYTRKTFATACPACPEWRDLMRDKANWAAAFGPDGVLYDQIGGIPPYPCFDSAHPHDEGKPSLNMTRGRQFLMSGILERAREIGPDFAFLTENITDAYSVYVDCLHGIYAHPSRAGDRRDCRLDPDRSEELNYPELFRYCFPDVIVTVRNPKPYLTPRFVNYAFAFGFRFEMELRYREDVRDIKADAWPEWRRYAKAVSALRRRHWDLLGHGRYTDERDLENQNPDVIARAFAKDSQAAVTCWNDTSGTQPLAIALPGYELKSWNTIDGTSSSLPHTLQPQEIGIAVYERKDSYV